MSFMCLAELTFDILFNLRFNLATAIQQEKSQAEFIEGIEGFKRTSLKHAETHEKNPLPDQDTINQEKAA